MSNGDIQAEAERCFKVGAQAWQAGRMDLAEQAFARAVQLVPGWAAAHANLGAILRRQGKSEAAVTCYRRALTLDADHAATLSNLGNALRDLGRFAEAETALIRAVKLDPKSIGYQYNLALVLRDLRRHDEAEALLEKIAASDPDNAEFQWDLALSRLYRGDYAKGFAGYEARLRLARNPPRHIAGPRWDGGEVAGKTVLLTSEQGFGDALQFARYVPLLAERGASIVLECMPELAELFAGLAGVKALIAKGAPPPAYDLWAPMTSLPHLMGTTFKTIPARMPYLKAPPRPNLMIPRPESSRLMVGLVWAGKTTPRDRSWPLEELLPLLENPLVTFCSLQMGPRTADLTRLGVDRLVVDGAPALTSFADTAAVMERLDLIITIDTSTGHLAGALGRPVWVLLRHVSDWRWQDEPLTSPWYPTMRLFRQPTPDDFKTPVAAMAKALADLLGHT
ncbi:hypothetical protein CU669_04820 [Paramagnetospirillum kuznetsovii]|uniref:Uncharacterized protein n=1 Tax=Paramagnetospirillum kuznetsovii TaxID=2053833 RepID=A0A364P2R9_9PROT|nr:tetratricopeptide repeat-containing glycosyltransferase family protein [Paramagnetospirillum kuznetsovii]RAU23447.1 hypothetical protein CU669_04820 [Paramagnetospirillum kuznetsovii]